MCLMVRVTTWCFFYLNRYPVYGVATRFAARWASENLGAPESLSYSQVSFRLIWNDLHGRYITQTYMDEICIHDFHICAIWDAQAFRLMNYWGINIESFCSEVCGYHQCPQTLADICGNEYLLRFQGSGRQGKISGVHPINVKKMSSAKYRPFFM